MIKLFILFTMMFSSIAFAVPVKIKDLANFSGVRGNDLLGYGIVTGLNGSGDSARSAPYTAERLSALLGQFGVAVEPTEMQPKNVAAVLVTAELPPFARSGDKINVKVSAIGDAKSLRGGMLAMTTLSAADGQIYAVAQGSVIAGGFSAEGRRESIVEGVPTSGAVPGGARVEREVDFRFEDLDELTLSLRNPDFATAMQIERVVNGNLGPRVAVATDAATIRISSERIGGRRLADIAARIGELMVEPDTPARVVLDAATGTVVIDRNVKISTVAISHGALSIRVTESDMVSQPNPFSTGQTVVVPSTSVQTTDGSGGKLAHLNGNANLQDLVNGLNELGVRPMDLIQILKAINAAGALHADMVIN
ncbi:MAG: flagellar basal body P-ring protein FlgI [Paracoccus sp. (in: a-proteobacteria)]|uniref:flagellar basal body P-ring protein FlgI n=1 Tax=Paracoccus sp. TaxID=267 RepID=UPI0026DF95C6|nr:flagellar basal body P-ring protein FlgI [Paracoccus sp. (in: a-proteobacteria)]MDO5620885.1 flagellar basal body P-ring protein FlgI [Paracoccus sp. (in: a-proteobacteria)]